MFFRMSRFLQLPNYPRAPLIPFEHLRCPPSRSSLVIDASLVGKSSSPPPLLGAPALKAAPRDVRLMWISSPKVDTSLRQLPPLPSMVFCPHHRGRCPFCQTILPFPYFFFFLLPFFFFFLFSSFFPGSWRNLELFFRATPLDPIFDVPDGPLFAH